MTTTPFICAKSGRPFLPDEGGQCHVCGRLFTRAYLSMWKFEDGEFAVCDEDCVRLNTQTDK
jgi:hypothetical protein